MTTKIDTIRAAVEAHFAAKEKAADEALRAMKATKDNPVDRSLRDYYYANHYAQDAAMTMLRDLLPLLPAVIILGDDNSYDRQTIIAATEVLESVTKMLLAEVES